MSKEQNEADSLSSSSATTCRALPNWVFSESGTPTRSFTPFLTTISETGMERCHFVPSDGDLYELGKFPYEVFDAICHVTHSSSLEGIFRDGFVPQTVSTHSIFGLHTHLEKQGQKCRVQVNWNPKVTWFGATKWDYVADWNNKYGNFIFKIRFSKIIERKCRKCYNEEMTGPGKSKVHDGYHFYLESYYQMEWQSESRVLITENPKAPTETSILFFPGKTGGFWQYDRARKRHSMARYITRTAYRLAENFNEHAIAFMWHSVGPIEIEHQFTVDVVKSHNLYVQRESRNWFDCLKKINVRRVPYRLCPDQEHVFKQDSVERDVDTLKKILCVMYLTSETTCELAQSVLTVLDCKSKSALDQLAVVTTEQNSSAVGISDIMRNMNAIREKLCKHYNTLSQEPFIERIESCFKQMLDWLVEQEELKRRSGKLKKRKAEKSDEACATSKQKKK